MKLWRRFVRWLAMDDLHAALSAGAKLARAGADAEAEVRCELAYARGYSEGEGAAYESVAEAVRRRMAGALDTEIKPEDVEEARKRNLH